MYKLHQKTAIVTGGGSGIGKEISIQMAKAGAMVHIVDINLEAAESVASSILTSGYQAKAWNIDLSHQKEVEKSWQAILNISPSIEILVNNAGISHIGTVENTTEEDMDKLYRVNVKGVFFSTQATLPYMKVKGGSIINLASVAASLGIKERFAYSMTKGAVLTMTYSIAKDCLPYQIRCNAISPGRIHTPFVDGYLAQHYPGREKEMYDKLAATQPIGRMGKPKEIANLAVYLASDEASFITGSNFSIDGGFTTLNS